VALYRSITTGAPQARDDTLRWDRSATRRDSTDPGPWTTLGEAQLHFGENASAVRSFREALRWDPWSVRALNGLANAAEAAGDRAQAATALARSLRADSNQPRARAQLDRLSPRP
jgi:Flp pilus assembly protein TadD